MPNKMFFWVDEYMLYMPYIISRAETDPTALAGSLELQTTTADSETVGSKPKLDRSIQSSELLRPRSPTVHYSPPAKENRDEDQADKADKTILNEVPSGDAKVTTVVKPPTAAKAKAQPPTKKATCSHPKKLASGDIKSEPPTPATAAAVAASLARKNTTEMTRRASGDGQGSQATGKEESSEAEDKQSVDPDLAKVDEEEPPGERGLTLEQVKAQKAAHARFVRFRRSFHRPLNATYGAYTA